MTGIVEQLGGKVVKMESFPTREAAFALVGD